MKRSERRSPWQRPRRTRSILLLCTVFIWAAVSLKTEALAAPDQYPQRSIDLVVPVAPGGGVDLNARAIANYATKMFGVPVNVVNKAGGEGIIGTAGVIRDRADGYTLLADSVGSSILMFATHKDLPFKPEDRSYIARVSSAPMVHLVKADSPWKNLRDVIEALKADPVRFTWGCTGYGSMTGYTVLEIIGAAGVDPAVTRSVVFGGGSEVAASLTRGDIHFMGWNGGAAQAFIRAGKLRVIGTTSSKPLLGLPGVPTAAEQGFPQLNANQWVGVSGPPGLPQFVLKRWQEILEKAAADPQFAGTVEKLDSFVDYLGGEPFRQWVMSEQTRTIKLYKGILGK